MIRATIYAIIAGAMLLPAQMHRADAQTGQTYEGGVMRTFVDAVYVQGDGNIIRRGNWTGPGWWGGSDDPNKPGNLPPVDSIDGVAMRHDFGYQIAEDYGKRFNSPYLEQQLKALADEIAVRDAMALPDDPMNWPMPPQGGQQDVRSAVASRAQIINGFSKLAIGRRAYGVGGGLARGTVEAGSAFVSGLTLGLLPTWGPILDRIELQRTLDQLRADDHFSAQNFDRQIQAKVEQWFRQHGQPDAPTAPPASVATAGEGPRCGNCNGTGLVLRTDDSPEARDGIFGDMMQCPQCGGTGIEGEPTEEQVRAAYNDGFQWGREVSRGMLSTAAIRAGTQERMGKYQHEALRRAFREGYATGSQ